MNKVNGAGKNLKNRTQSAVVIIGAGFGDEGKGLMTDFRASPFGADCIVARFNGGAQAGHTVTLPAGQRHIFSHLGSGTLTGAATFLSRHFVNNPLLFRREKKELSELGIASPIVFADARGIVTTPYDMLVNQWAEAARGSGKHGSCGVGFGETVERNLNEQFAIRISDLSKTDKLFAKLNDIRKNWIPARLQALKISTISAEHKNLLFGDKLRDDFIESAIAFNECIEISEPDILTTRKGIIFEGAQGLLLDEDYGWFPNVTRSHTGLKTAVQLAAEAGIKQLESIYVTRAYATRHGAGYFPHELPAKPYAKIKDVTNIPNPHQDALRYGWLDIDLVNFTINRDFERFSSEADLEIIKSLAVTCLDQLDEDVQFVENGKICETSVDNFLNAIGRSGNFKKMYESYGPTRTTLTGINF